MTSASIVIPRRPSSRRRIILEVYNRFGGSCHSCGVQLDINGSALPGYPEPFIVQIPGEQHPRRLTCPECAPVGFEPARPVSPAACEVWLDDGDSARPVTLAVPSHPKPAHAPGSLSRRSHEPSFLVRLYQDFQGRCAYCGHATFLRRKSGGHPDQATIDHMDPVSRGGSKKYQNLALACFECNNLKGNMTVREFYRALMLVVARLAEKGGS